VVWSCARGSGLSREGEAAIYITGYAAQIAARLGAHIIKAVAGDRYSYRDLDDFTDLMQRSLQTVPSVARVTRAGVLGQRVYLEYSQERLASYGLQPGDLAGLLQARNAILPGGVLERGGRRLTLEPSGEFKSAAEIGDILVGAGTGDSAVYLRDLVDIQRDYESPP